MSAFGGKADIEVNGFYFRFLTHNGHCELSVFDNFHRDVAARIALEGALVVIRCVRLAAKVHCEMR